MNETLFTGMLSNTYQDKPNLTFPLTDDVAKELENTVNKSGVPGESYYVRCDVTDEDDIKVTIY